MAKVVGPLFSVDARGKLADSLVFMGWRGLKTVRQWTKPSNPNTESQKEVRNAFSASVENWHPLLGNDKEAWKLRASGEPKSGFNIYMGLSSSALIELDAFNLFNEFGVSDDGSGDTEVSITPSHGGTAKFWYGTQPGNYHDYEEVSLTAETASTTVIDNLTSGQTYYGRFIQEEEKVDGDDLRGESGDYEFVAI